jgi:hypothetical protein
MTKRSISQAIRRHLVATSPVAVREALRAVRRAGLAGLVTAASIRADAAADLRDAIAAEIVH